MYPGRQQKPQRIGSGVVGILIAVNVDPTRAGRIDSIKELFCSTPAVKGPLRGCAATTGLRRFRPFGDSRGICRVRTPKLSFKFSIGMAHRDPLLTLQTAN